MSIFDDVILTSNYINLKMTNTVGLLLERFSTITYRMTFSENLCCSIR
jgi:hypothetical protein